MSKKDSHRKALELLSLNPGIISIDPKDVLTSSIEQAIYSSQGSLLTNIDLVFILKSHSRSYPIKAIIVEYKSNNSNRLSEKAENQLEKAVDFYQRNLKIPAEGRLITGDSYPALRKGKLSMKKVRL